jgi:4,5-DOPA dioxygenase extradiol
MTHNLRLVFAGKQPALDAPEIVQSKSFRSWFAERSAMPDWPALFDYRRQAPEAAYMHPSDEHLLPWYVAAGAGGEKTAALRIHDSVTYGCLAMDAYAFGGEAEALRVRLSS